MTLKKRLLALTMTLAVAASMAVPSFAASATPYADSVIENKTYKFYPFTTNVYLNTASNSEAYNGCNVNIYTSTNDPDQRWYIRKGKNTSVKICSSINVSFALNINHSGNNCNLHTTVNNTTENKSDCDVLVNKGTIRLNEWRDLNLYAQGTSSGSNVCWSSSTTDWRYYMV